MKLSRVGRAFVMFFCAALLVSDASVAELPQFIVPGHEAEMKRLNELHALHHERAFVDCTLWDGWLPHATLWTAPSPRQLYRNSFLQRRIDSEGYVSMQQHRGLAHSEGWPFPAWQQSTGMGWHFSVLHDVWAVQIFSLTPLASTDGWEIDGATIAGIDPTHGLKLVAHSDQVRITTPAFRCGTSVAPFVRLEWALRNLPPEANPRIEWLLEGDTQWHPHRHALIVPDESSGGGQYNNVPLYLQPGYTGIVTRYRITLDRATGAQIDLKSLITAIDTRHPITNSLFLRGCCEHFAWTHDVEFLRNNIDRMRKSLRFMLDEFAVRQGKHVSVPWVGHDGRSGLTINPDGTTTMLPGQGVGNNYWDLLPFGGHDALATIYLYDALAHFAALERRIAAHPEWTIAPAENPSTHEELLALAEEIKADFQARFWNREHGRFVGWIDQTGKSHDYGFTFVNLEAIHYGLASPQQAKSILEWLDGQREIADDTSRGADIYHWRFAPRATTRRNVETYSWVWNNPASIAWGGQVQDGGAVLGFSYHDLMARLATNGPDDAWRRLREILTWFDEVQTEGGYRAYYAKPGRGTLQGGGTAGGLGIDQEFYESVLVPQIMLYGFLGFDPHGETFQVKPRLPSNWPSLKITGIHFHNQVLDITAYQDGKVEIESRSGSSSKK
jgi:hypothetical protein